MFFFTSVQLMLTDHDTGSVQVYCGQVHSQRLEGGVQDEQGCTTLPSQT